MNGNITKEGIQKDLEWMKRVGVGGLQVFDVSLDTPQVVGKRLVYMTPEWQDAFRYATTLADQLDLELAVASSAGWSETGGPWVEPKDGMKKVVWSATSVDGGKRFTGKLARPSSVAGPFQEIPARDDSQQITSPSFYRDAAVVAYRTPRALITDPHPQIVSACDSSIDAKPLVDGDSSRVLTFPISHEHPACVLFDYGKPQRFRAASISRPSTITIKWTLEASDSGQTFRRIAEFPRGVGVSHATLAFPPVTARFLRVTMVPDAMKSWFELSPNAPGAEVPAGFAMKADSASLSELHFYGGARVDRFEDKAGFSIASDYSRIQSGANARDEAVDPRDVLILTGKMRDDGTLDWAPPVGNWTVLRLGYSLTGATNHPASPEATGLEVDKLDRRAVSAYLDGYLHRLEDVVGRHLVGRHGIRALLTDSIETLGQNWTGAMIDEFKTRRGYDPTPWLPSLTGVIVGTAARTDRFLWDFRKTLMDLISENHYRQIAQTAHEHGLTFYNESLEGYPTMALGDDLDMRQYADVPMAAFWATYDGRRRDGIANHIGDIRGAASVAHIFGHGVVAAESLTSSAEPFAYSPATLRPIIDMEFALGVNLPVIHTSVHQPTEQAPGMTLGPYGQQFTRHETWAEMAGPWITYLSRTAYLLQQGRFVGDVAWFYGEDGPLASVYDDGAPKGLPEGYGFDFVSPNILLNHLHVRDGRLLSPAGGGYRLLYLGSRSGRMTLGVLRKLKTLSDAGITMAGPRPIGSPSLADEGHEREYNGLVAALWGKGKVIATGEPGSLLRKIGLAPDFECEGLDSEEHVMFQHRELPYSDLYFLTNRTARTLHLRARFRVAGRVPELWYADTGRRQAVSWFTEGGRTAVPLDLYPHESVFVVFGRQTSVLGEQVPTSHDEQIIRLDGDWLLSFQSGRGAPSGGVVGPLGSWTDSDQPGIKYFSGTGTYRKVFNVRAADIRDRQSVSLDLGDVGEIAEVVLNSKPVGTAWHPPFRLDVTEAIKPGINELEVRVANLWVNRLIGDKQPGARPIAITVSPTYQRDAPLRRSGLIGPVRILRSSN